MTTYTKRRGRRSLAAILAAMLMASVLAVVAGAPAHAANTSSPVLYDHDNDASTPGVREFAGRDRYQTALSLARNFGRAKGGFGTVSTAFVASGESLVDAVAVSGLTGLLDAPVLLTQSDSLHPGVRNYIEDFGVQDVYVLGGTAAVSDAVRGAIGGLVNRPEVHDELQGPDRYATAAAIASKLGSGAAWCGGDDPAALLANGETLTEAMIAGPVANRRQLPVLLTASDELPMATADFISDAGIKHVVIVGGTDSVSADVESQLEDLDVTTGRIGGADAAEVSVNMATTMLDGDCKDELGAVAGAMAALVNGGMDRPDGVAATPVLAGSLAGGDLVPMLIVGDTLPAKVRDYLDGTKAVDSAGKKVNYQIVAIGGTAAVSEDVMEAALEAARSADALTVTIGSNEDKNEDGKINAEDLPAVGDDTVRLYFSDAVIADTDGKLTATIRDILELNESPAVLATTDTSVNPPEPVGKDTTTSCVLNEVTVKLGSKLKAGDVLSLIGGATLGAGGDQREVGAASYTVPPPAADKSRPTVNVIMIAGRTTAEFTVSDNGKTLDAETVADNDLALADITKVGDGANAATTGQTVAGVTNGTIANNTPDPGTGTITFGQALEVGDRITIASNVLNDAAGNKNLQRSFTAIAPHKSPRITSVTMSSLKHSAQAAITVPDELKKTENANDEIEITAKADGDAAGAKGNAWRIVYDVASTWDAKKDVDIAIRVNSASTTVSVRFVNGTPTFEELKAKLESNSTFNALFEVKLKPSNTTDCDATIANLKLELATTDRQVNATNDAGKMTGGVTEVAIETRFDGYIKTLDDTELLTDILNATAVRAQKAAPTTYATVSAALTGVRAALALTTLTTTGDNVNKTVSFPGMLVRYEATTSNAGMLPKERDLVTTLAGHDGATAIVGTGTAQKPQFPAISTVTAVATGYAPDANTGDNNTGAQDKVDEDKNGFSSVWLGRSPNVKAPS